MIESFLSDAAESAARPVIAENGLLRDEFRARVRHVWEPHLHCQRCAAIAAQAYSQGARAHDILRCGLDVIVDGPNVTKTFEQVTGIRAPLLDILSQGVLPRLKELGARVVFCGPLGWCTELKQQAKAAWVPIDPRCLIEAPGATDDQFTIDWAVDHDAFIVTNDHYLEHQRRFPQAASDRYLMKFAWTPNPSDGGWRFALADADQMKAYSARAPCERLRWQQPAPPHAPPPVPPFVLPRAPPPMAPIAPPIAEPLHAPHASGSTFCMVYDVSNAEAGRIIGKGGSMIQALRAKHFPVKIHVCGDGEDHRQRRSVEFKGPADAIERARVDLVQRLAV